MQNYVPPVSSFISNHIAGYERPPNSSSCAFRKKLSAVTQRQDRFCATPRSHPSQRSWPQGSIQRSSQRTQRWLPPRRISRTMTPNLVAGYIPRNKTDYLETLKSARVDWKVGFLLLSIHLTIHKLLLLKFLPCNLKHLIIYLHLGHIVLTFHYSYLMIVGGLH